VTVAAPKAPLLEHSPYESARFGLRIFRGTPELADAGALIDEIRRERVDIAILRVADEAQMLAATICEAGMPSIVADTLVQYSLDICSRHTVPSDTSIRLRRAEHRDMAALEWMVRQIFEGYATHYHANPLFDPARILDGYAEWAVRHIEADARGRLAWIVEADGEDVGFSCIELATDHRQARGVLNGVLPAQRGRGVYRRMLRAMLDRFGDEGVHRFVISTQAHNAAVQRVWSSEQLTLDRSESTVHVNALLGAGASAHASRD
jgi:GNAT superfamily N-acetyltransferase